MVIWSYNSLCSPQNTRNLLGLSPEKNNNSTDKKKPQNPVFLFILLILI